MLDATIASWPDIQARLERGPTIAVLAAGAQEQHGPHLPLATDTVMAHGVARRIANALNGILLPPLAYGDAWNNNGFVGTLSITPATLRALVADIGRGLWAQSIHALLIVNGHYGNREPLLLAARDLQEQHQFPVLVIDYPRLDQLAAQICSSTPAAPFFYHADEVETSIMLALAPEQVQIERAVAEYPIFPASYGMEPIQLNSFCQSGVFGDPTQASAAKGEQLLAGIVSGILELVVQRGIAKPL